MNIHNTEPAHWEIGLDPDAWTDEQYAEGKAAYYAALDDLDAARVPQDRVARFVALYAWCRGNVEFSAYMRRMSTWAGKAIDEQKKFIPDP